MRGSTTTRPTPTPASTHSDKAMVLEAEADRAGAPRERPHGTVPPAGRSIGRIGGACGPEIGADAVERIRCALGCAAQVMHLRGDAPAAKARCLAADWDSCWLGDECITSLSQWSAILAAGRLDEADGAYALAWIDADGALCLARDPIGERTLYYHVSQTHLVFASTLVAVLAANLVERRLDRLRVVAYLSYAYVPGEHTLIEGVRKLLPGEVVKWRAGRLVRHGPWKPPAETPASCVAAEPVERLRGNLERAVERRLDRGRPMAAFLSGGLDSSLVLALARRRHDSALTAWSISFGDELPNELPYSRLVAAHCGVEHRVLEVSPKDILEYLDRSMACLGDPIGDPLTVPNYLLFQAAAAHGRAVLNGEGGDPCFGGPKNQPMLLAALLGDGLAAASDDPLARSRSYLRAHQKCYDDLASMLTDGVREAAAGGELERELVGWLSDPRWSSFVTRLMAVNVSFKGAHHILPKVDALSFPIGLVARSPLFDRRVVETAFAIPPQLKLYGSQEKYVLKRAVAELLPAAIIERPKSGMLVPVEAWFRGPLLPQARERLLDGLAGWNLVRRDYIERLLAGRLGAMRPRHGAKIWLLAALESWLRMVAAAA
jgi:asparagine synthase (glutamine-hydrolysing)